MRYLFIIPVLIFLMSCNDDLTGPTLSLRDLKFPDEITGKLKGKRVKKVKDQYCFLNPKATIPAHPKYHFNNSYKMSIPDIEGDMICQHFDTQGNLLVTVNKRFFGGEILYTYDSFGLLISEEQWEEGGTFFNNKYNIDSKLNVLNCRVVERINADPKITRYHSYKHFRFDGQGRLISMMIFDTTRIAKEYVKYEYNKADALILKRQYSYLKEGSKDDTSENSYQASIITNYYYTGDHLDSTFQKNSVREMNTKTYYDNHGYPSKMIQYWNTGTYKILGYYRYTYYE